MRYQKGQSGNLNGRPKGSGPCQYIQNLQQKYEPEALELYYKKSIELGQNDDLSGLSVIYKSGERKRGHVIPIELKGSVQEQMESIKQAATAGQLTANDISLLMGAVAAQVKILEAVDLQVQLDELKEKVKEQNDRFGEQGAF
jgi:hypothetical protein